MTIQILGSGCPNCRKLEANAVQALKSLGMKAEIQKITDSGEIMEMGVMLTPALAVDGVVKISGRVPAPEEIAGLLRAHA